MARAKKKGPKPVEDLAPPSPPEDWDAIATSGFGYREVVVQFPTGTAHAVLERNALVAQAAPALLAGCKEALLVLYTLSPDGRRCFGIPNSDEPCPCTCCKLRRVLKAAGE